MPEGFDFAEISRWLDEKYFDAEDEGRDTDAAAFFALARLISALSFADSAVVPADYSEAAYEAIMSLPDPQAFVFQS